MKVQVECSLGNSETNLNDTWNRVIAKRKMTNTRSIHHAVDAYFSYLHGVGKPHYPVPAKKGQSYE